MKILSTGLTRRILHFAIGLHRDAVLAECEAIERHVEGLRAAVDRQKEAVTVEQNRLEAIRLAARFAEQKAEAAWRAGNDELAQYPVPNPN